MARRQSNPTPPREDGYLHRTHHPLNCLAFIGPLLVAYEVGGLFYHSRLLAPQHLRAFLRLFGATAAYLPPLLIVVVLLVWHGRTRRKWHVDGGTVAGMLAESLLWWIPLLGMNMLLARLLGGRELIPAASAPAALSAVAAPAAGLAADILTGIGAGIYEEFLFRLVAINLVLLIAADLLGAPRKYAVPAAVAVVSVAFGLYHHLGTEQFNWIRCLFRILAAGYLAVLFVCRGLGIAAGAHACYNLAVALSPP